MIVDNVSFIGHRCFKKHWSGFDAIKPINVIIGRNNSGKTHLLDLAEALCKKNLADCPWKSRFHGILDEQSLRRFFPENTSGGDLQGGYWSCHGKHFINARVMWEMDPQGQVSGIAFDEHFNFASPYGERSTQARIETVKQILTNPQYKLSDFQFRRLYADRDVKAELQSNEMNLSPDGVGATNIIRRYILTSNLKYPREVIQRNLLKALNDIFAGDGCFTEIQVKHHDDPKVSKQEGYWEVYLGEERKGLIPLSNSGSGLKTILLVLLNLLVIPEIASKKKSQYVYAFEELENNLHPALLRRLLIYLEKYALQEQATIFLTTHSSTALDLFGYSPNAHITLVEHDGETAHTKTVSGHLNKLSVISELGVKPSDLLQSNGIIWVEGPSDRIYVNRWIELFSDGKWKEGRDYQCAFYGGSLLAHAQVAPEELAVEDMVNLFKVNANIAVICDSDRTSRTGKGSNLRERTRRIKAELAKIPGALCWITDPKEIEHYLPGSVIAKVFGKDKLPDPQPYKPFFPYSKKQSYLESALKRKTIDKVELALKACPHMTKDLMASRFDLGEKMGKLIASIARWNSPDHRG